MHNGQLLALEYDKVESSSEWSVTLNQQKVMLNMLMRIKLHVHMYNFIASYILHGKLLAKPANKPKPITVWRKLGDFRKWLSKHYW